MKSFSVSVILRTSRIKAVPTYLAQCVTKQYTGNLVVAYALALGLEARLSRYSSAKGSVTFALRTRCDRCTTGSACKSQTVVQLGDSEQSQDQTQPRKGRRACSKCLLQRSKVAGGRTQVLDGRTTINCRPLSGGLA